MYNSGYEEEFLENLKYVGPLYHYTTEEVREKMFSCIGVSNDKLPYDEHCIALRFTNIRDMTSNDSTERRKVSPVVKRVVDELLRKNEVTEDFAECIINFQPNDIGDIITMTDEIYDSSFDGCGGGFKNEILDLNPGKIDYYVACFSKNPENNYLREWIKSRNPQTKGVVRIAFDDSLCDPGLLEHKEYKWHMNVGRYLKHNLPPFCCVEGCFLSLWVREVAYDDNLKDEMIEKYLLSVYNDFWQGGDKDKEDELKDDLKLKLENMYFLFDAFFKDYRNEEQDYFKEDEVRIVVKMKHGPCPKAYRDRGVIWCGDQDDQNNGDYKYLYLPISRLLIRDDGC